MGAMLTADWDLLAEYFVVQGFRDAENDQKWIIELSPKKEMMRKIFTKITLRGSRYIESLTLYEKNNDHSEITFEQTLSLPIEKR
ncbi:MAG: hypothetical protein HRU15_08610, partial [Planctomycetes bacterium]|nr:hypothetical protein [Planctomycetota bacterium]